MWCGVCVVGCGESADNEPKTFKRWRVWFSLSLNQSAALNFLPSQLNNFAAVSSVLFVSYIGMIYSVCRSAGASARVRGGLSFGNSSLGGSRLLILSVGDLGRGSNLSLLFLVGSGHNFAGHTYKQSNKMETKGKVRIKQRRVQTKEVTRGILSETHPQNRSTVSVWCE